MKRRGFLKLLGLAPAAPFFPTAIALPAAAIAAPEIIKEVGRIGDYEIMYSVSVDVDFSSSTQWVGRGRT